MTERTTAYIMVGLPGSGKSTFVSRKLGHRPNGLVVLSTDQLIEDYASNMNKTYDEVFGSFIAVATRVFNDALQHMIDNPTQVLVIDQTNLTAKKRKTLVQSLRKSYDKIIAIYVPAPAEDVLQRRLAVRDGKSIPAHILQSMRTSFTVPTLDEGFDHIYTVG